MLRNHFERFKALGDEPVYCEAEPSEVFYKGSDDEDYDSSWERKWAYERTAANFLNGGTTSLMSARLRGPFDKASGWTNPWRSKSLRITKPISALQTSKHTARPVVNTRSRKTSKQSNPQEPSVCHLPSPVSLDNKAPEPHLYLDDDDIARVEEWRTSINHPKSQPDTFWAPSTNQAASRKRQAQNNNWLKRTEKRRRTDGGAAQNMEQFSLLAHDELSTCSLPTEDMDSGDDKMEEDELQADTETKACATADVATPSRRSPTRRGLQRSPRDSTSKDDSDDELSRPSETAQRSRVWRTASARSQVSRPGRGVSPRSSPSKRYARGRVVPATQGTTKASEAANDEDLREWETQQDDSFVFRVRRKPDATGPQTAKPEQHEQSSSSLSSAPDEISDFTSLGTREDDPPVDEIVSISSRTQHSQNLTVEAVRNSLRATPESSVICTSQPGLDSSTLVEKEQQDLALEVGDKEPVDVDKECEATLATKITNETEPVCDDDPSRTEGAPSTVELSNGLHLDRSAEQDPTTAPTAVGESRISDSDGAGQEHEEDKPAESLSTPVEELRDLPALPQRSGAGTGGRDDSGKEDESSGSVSASPGRDSILSNAVQCRVAEQIFLESTHMDDDQTINVHPPEHAETPSNGAVESEPTDLGDDRTPVKHKHLALTESQQTPWQASMQGTHLTPHVQQHGSQATQTTQSVAFSQPNSSIPPISQQTPWYRETPAPRLSQPSSPLQGRTGPVVSLSSSAQSPWSRSFEQMRAAAHTALFAAGINLSFSREQNQPVPEEMPEETGSVASAETSSLHTAPSTPENDAPDAVFADASSSPPETQLSPSPQSDSLDEGFNLKPFSAFRSPSPEKTVSKRRKARISHGRLSGTQSILIAASNPWNSVPRTKKRVSWALVDDAPEDEETDRPGRSSVSTPSRARAASPPPEQALADLPTGEKDAFQKHFSAVKMKVKGHSHRILPTPSQQILHSPAPTAMAEAFLTADEMAKLVSSPKTDADEGVKKVMNSTEETEEMQDLMVTQDEELDDVDEVLRNISDFIDVMDVETDIQLAKEGSTGVVAENLVKGRASLTSPLDINVWEQY